MTIAHLSAVSLSFIIYGSLAIAFLGWGKATNRLLGLKSHESQPLTLTLWIGWASTLLAFQLMHFLLPLTAVVVVPVLIAGIAYAVPAIVVSCRRCTIRPSVRMLVARSGITILVLAVSGWIASRSMLSPVNYDSGLYHFNLIRWINSFPLVLGLGNLHGRLAFNQSFFTFAGSLNFHPYFGHGRSIANSFLLLLTMATFAELLLPLLRRPALLTEAHPFQHTPALILFPALGFLAISSNGLSSPSPDLTATLLQLTMFVVLAQGLGERTSGLADQNCRAVFLGILATTAVTVKLSNLAFSTAIWCYILFYAKRPRARRIVFRMTALSAMIILVWLVRGVFLSGAPLYPSTIGYLPFSWAVPIEKITTEANWIYSWAREPGARWSAVLGNWHWFTPWFGRLSRNVEVMYSLCVAALFFILTLLHCRFQSGRRLRCGELALLLPSIAGLVYWFFTAPDPRFAHGLFFLISTTSILLFLSSLQGTIDRRRHIIVIGVVFIVANLHLAAYVMKHRSELKSISCSGWHPVPEVPLDKKVTDSGLSVYCPKSGDQCWDSPLPSTPYFNPRLRLRNPQSLGSGFTVAREEQ